MLRTRILVPLLAVAALMLGQFAFISLARAAPPDPVAAHAVPASGDLVLMDSAANTSATLAVVADPLSGLAPPSAPALARWQDRSKFDAPRGGDDDEEGETARTDPPDPSPLPA